MRRVGVADEAPARHIIGWCERVIWSRHSSDAPNRYRVMLHDEAPEVRQFFDVSLTPILDTVVDDFGNLVRVP